MEPGTESSQEEAVTPESSDSPTDLRYPYHTICRRCGFRTLYHRTVDGVWAERNRHVMACPQERAGEMSEDLRGMLAKLDEIIGPRTKWPDVASSIEMVEGLSVKVSPLGSVILVLHHPLDDEHLLVLQDGVMGKPLTPWYVWTAPEKDEEEGPT